MRYALIADVHGNLRALERVLEDARQQGVGEYLFLGDYYADFPFPNEVARMIFSIDNARFIRGNKEGYLASIRKHGLDAWSGDQFATLRWSYAALEPEYLSRYLEMHEALTIECPGGGVLHLAHEVQSLFPARSRARWEAAGSRLNPARVTICPRAQVNA